TNDSIDLGVRYDVSDYNKLELNDLRDPDLFKVLGRAFVVVENSVWESWNDDVKTLDCSGDGYESILKHYESLELSGEFLLFFKKIRSAISVYNREYEFCTGDLEPSLQAIVQLIRYAPELAAKKDAQIYFDKKSECFGLIYKQTKKSKGTLNLIVTTNNEIIFSFVRKVSGVVKVTGRAYIGDSLDNSIAIKSLFKMMEW
ncbi:hypothetical protein, partial [Klebsiella pneumoniae]|uniref:hypothetical protein n=1 Tax=Klebsiella pneumoniae TaxID=573 RepID=UPI0013B47123